MWRRANAATHAVNSCGHSRFGDRRYVEQLLRRVPSRPRYRMRLLICGRTIKACHHRLQFAGRDADARGIAAPVWDMRHFVPVIALKCAIVRYQVTAAARRTVKIWLGRALASAIRSFTDLTGSDGCTMSTPV